MDNNLVVFGTFVIALITVVGIILTNQKTRESNELTRESNKLIKSELNAKLRPWIKIDEIKVTHALLTDGRNVTWKKFNDEIKDRKKLKEARLSHTIENVGALPTEKLYFKTFHDCKEFSKETLFEKVISSDAYPLMPGETLPFVHKIKSEDFYGEGEYYGIHIGYFINNKETYVIGKIWRIDNHKITTHKYWID